MNWPSFKSLSKASYSSMAILSLHHFFLTLLSAFFLSKSVSCQSDSGFISLDCGANSSYIEPTTAINYDSDAAFITTGTIYNISSDINKNVLNQQLWSLRSFPEGDRNCYKLKVRAGTKYLIRASFRYGNYDGKSSLPAFDLYFGPNLWDTIKFGVGDRTVNKEIIHIVSSSKIEICLVNIGSGIPFISALELRPLRNLTYKTESGSLATFLRLDIGSINNQSYRYKDDIYDRIWEPAAPLPGWISINTSEQVLVQDSIFFQPSPAVMKTAATPINDTLPMIFQWIPPDPTTEFFVYMYFAELKKLQANQSRAFDILLNGKIWYNQTISPKYLSESVVYNISRLTGGTYNFSIVKSDNSTLPPILNAIEIYRVINFSLSETNGQDVEAIANIKGKYGVKRNWQGDPCAPRDFIWQGVNCSFVDSQPPRITSLDLSSNGLTGEIAQDIRNLEMLESLDLSNNSLSGPIPDFLTQLPSLKVLNLERNYLSGLIPSQLVEKSNNGSLTLRFGENVNLFTTAPSEKKKSNVVVPVLASVAGFLLLVIIVAAAIFWTKRRKQQGAGSGVVKQNGVHSKQWETIKRQYAYSDILRMTNNFERLLGEGGFGRVYYGRIKDIEVAVKMLSPQAIQGYQQFEAEVELLMRVHHRNLTTLVGYCNESTNRGLIYEYMGKGTLESIISVGKSRLLNWEARLHIAVDVAHGLEYLHNGIRPTIVHRDVKSSNILLDDNFRAKVADFGLSRTFPTDGGASHVTTNVVGTPGYLDPEYHTSYRFNEKSDVYSFGIVLQEIITGKPVLARTQNNMIHISQWVGTMLSQGDISSIIDPELEENFNINSIWKAIEIAMSCASRKSAYRPSMSQVVVELNECLAMELAHDKDYQPETVYADSIPLSGPWAR